jgi:hypothetical protein
LTTPSNNLKTECDLEHCFVHGGKAIEAVLCMFFIVANILQGKSEIAGSVVITLGI